MFGGSSSDLKTTDGFPFAWSFGAERVNYCDRCVEQLSSAEQTTTGGIYLGVNEQYNQ